MSCYINVVVYYTYSPQVNVDTDDGSYRYRTHDNFLVYGQFGLKTFYGGHTNHQFRNIFAYVGQVLLFWDAPMDDATANRFTNNRVILNRASGPQMGSALIGSLRISCFLTEGLFGHSR